MRPLSRLLVLSTAIAATVPGFAIARGCELTDPKPRAELYEDDSGLMKMPVSELVAQAEAGNAGAQNALGVVYGTGRGVKLDAGESSKWYRRAAETGLAIAQANLAYMYLSGEGVPKDIGLAFQWAEKSAAQGHYRGQLFLGYMYGTGTGVERNGAEAERCYLLAAKQGNLDAQKTLSRMYEKGDGVPMDTQKAILWLHRVRDGSLSGRTWREE